MSSLSSCYCRSLSILFFSFCLFDFAVVAILRRMLKTMCAQMRYRWRLVCVCSVSMCYSFNLLHSIPTYLLFIVEMCSCGCIRVKKKEDLPNKNDNNNSGSAKCTVFRHRKSAMAWHMHIRTSKW